MSYGHLRFGIETEALLTPRQVQEFKNLEAFAEYILKDYQVVKHDTWPDMYINLEGSYAGSDVHMKWSLSNDITIKPDHNTQCS